LNPATALIAAHVLSMLGYAAFAALLPELHDLWSLSNAEAGMIASAFFVGYVATVSGWTALTDRIEPRSVYLVDALATAAGCAGFGALAQGLVGAALFQAVLGAGVAGTYMPGLRLLTDRTAAPGKAATSRSTPRSSASAPRCPWDSSAWWRKRSAGALPSSPQRQGRWLPA